MKQVYPAGFLFWFCILLSFYVSAQTVTIDRGGTVQSCGGLFVDSGDTTAVHAPSGTRQVITLCADDSSIGTHVQLDFTDIDIQGTLTVFNGTSTAADTLRTITRANVGDRLSLAATLANRGGCLTLEFISTGVGNGWRADINCIVACQPIVAQRASSIPEAVPSTNGYIDVCVGEPITLSGRGRYPENGATYTQSDVTSSFLWTFQNGDQAAGQTVTYAYDRPGAYVAELYITDNRGCVNANRINQRIRVAAPPKFDAPDRAIPQVCPGESIALLAGTDKTGPNAYRPTPQAVSFNTTQTFSEQISIPDRQDEVYQSALDIQLFSPGQRVNSGADIAQVCVTIEHSFLTDLDMWIECPDGSRITLLEQSAGQGGVVNHRFGYGETDGTGPEPAETYCWTASAAQTVVDYTRGQSSGGTSRPILPFDRDYLPVEGNFDGLTGCAMNGEWRLNVVDNFLEDDGTVYSWNITFSDELVPSEEAYTVPIRSTRWEDDGQFSFYRPDSVIYTPVHPGYANHRLTVTDDFGCTYDTLIRVDVVSPFRNDCFACGEVRQLTPRDTQVCVGQEVQLDLSEAFAFDTLVRWQAQVRQPLTGSHTSFLRISDQAPAVFAEPLADQLAGVCLELTADLPLSGVEIALIPPGGTPFVLVPRGSTNGTRIDNCFRPGDGLNWNVLVGQALNGEWALRIDDASGQLSGELVAWSVELVDRPTLSYSWSAGNDELSCTDCPNPTLTPSEAATYTLTATSSRGCSQRIDYRIEPLSAEVDYEATIDHGCADQPDGSIILRPLTATPVSSYTWSTGAVTRDLAGLEAGQYELTVTTINGCTKAFTYEVAPPPGITVAIDTTIAVSCFGEADGSIRLRVEGGYGGYEFAWSDNDRRSGSTAENLLAGNYGVTVTDAAGCFATATVTVPSPDLLTLDLTVRDVSCRGGSDGEIVPMIQGGSVPYAYRWSDGSTDPSLVSQPAGTYSLTVTDANGCRQTAEATISQPDIPLSARVVNEVAGCFATRTNQATVLARGGNGDYRYVWSNGETGATAFTLPAGLNSVQVTDKSGCTYLYDFETVSRPQIIPTITLASGDACRSVYDRTLEARAPGNYFAYRWSTGANGSRLSQLQPATTYTVTMTDAEGCAGVATYTTEAHVPWSIDLETTPVTCFGDRDGALRILSASNRQGTSFTYQWGANTGFAEGPAIVERPAGAYALTMTDAIGCTFDTLLPLPGPALLRLSETIQPVSCFGASDGSLSITPSGGNGAYGFAWSTGSSEPKITGLNPGEYRLTVTDAKGCREEVGYAIAAPEQIILDISTQGPVCGGEYNGRIDLTAVGGQAPLEFSLDDERYTKASTFSGLGGGNYTVYARDVLGCTVSRIVTIEDGPLFSVDLGPDREILFGDSLVLSADILGGGGDLDYAWEASYEGTLSCTDCPAPTAKPQYEIDYRLALMDAVGCLAEDRVRVRVRKVREVAVPTAFTPNDDGNNDRLLVHGRPGTHVISFSIFDRWGGWLYTGQDFPVNDEDAGWDGRNERGKELDSGVYIFKLEVEHEDGSRELLSGQTTLIR
ncbi:gliding motility-associated-like protein [Neolewinella xylanilytica]|uniref:Gliding motility-associated-like protein n=1 Tax=Neolewinella xylanilytica TaxID=1514080 RepID=A0A2S6I5P7_9BACT|nr:proprotein convertase P-domain-containing protein [Neolewinella xylanilytica]PPK86459.1 gliding motility-associated-like protein [Neolewinella xylanilytica]